MDEKETRLECRIKVAQAMLEVVERSASKPLAEKERLRWHWEGELTNAQERLYDYRLKKWEGSNVLPFRRRPG
jgi:hypothetical protein